MKRRNFVKNVAVTGAAGLMVGGASAAAIQKEIVMDKIKKKDFKLKYAPHFGMFKYHGGEDLLGQLDFIADAGFKALEDNGMKGRPLEEQKAIAYRMEKLDLEMGVFVAHTIYWNEPSLASGDETFRSQFLEEIKESVEVAKRCNAKWMTVVPGHIDPRQDFEFQTAHVMESLKRASALLEPHGLIMVLEPLNFRDHPGLFLTKISQAYSLCKGVNSPSCKILDDLYHQQITEGNLIPNMDLAWNEIAYFQMGDNPGRKEPTTGEINYNNVFKHIKEQGFTGILGMEHGNSNEGKEGELAVIKAYAKSDDF